MVDSAEGFLVEEIVARLGGDLIGEGSRRVRQVAPLDAAGPDQISFLSNPKYARQLAATRAGAVILGRDAADAYSGTRIVCRDPYLYFARVSQLLNPAPRPMPGVHPTAAVETNLPPSVSVGAGACVGEGARIGEGAIIGAGCVIGRAATVGAATVLHARVTVYADCVVGARAVIHSGAVIGADGFGFAREADASWVKIPQIGRVVIGDDVEIGANTTIDRGALEDTVIEDGVKLDNQIQVGHNVRIGSHSAIAGCVGIAGSTRIGRRCMIGGAAMILGHLDICDDVTVTAGTLIGKSIIHPGTYSGTMPSAAHRDWLKNAVHLRHLDDMAAKIRALEERLAQLEKKP